MNIKSTLALASLGLSLFYIYVLVLLLNPAVSEQYQRYYISRESRVSAAELAPNRNSVGPSGVAQAYISHWMTLSMRSG